jgi:hypothetical protein
MLVLPWAMALLPAVSLQLCLAADPMDSFAGG